MPRSLLNAARFGDLTSQERAIITACERSVHESAMESLAGCRCHLREDRAVAAAIVGTFSGLCRIIAQSVDPETMSIALGAILKAEVETWRKTGENA